MGFQEQNLLVPFSGEPTLTEWGPKGMLKQQKKRPGILHPMEWKSWLLLYIHSWIWKFLPFWRIFGWISGTKFYTKGRSPGFSIGFFQNPVRRLQKKSRKWSHTRKKDIQSHRNWGWVFCWVCFVGVQSYEHYRTSVSVWLDGCLGGQRGSKNPQL